MTEEKFSEERIIRFSDWIPGSAHCTTVKERLLVSISAFSYTKKCEKFFVPCRTTDVSRAC